MPSPTEAECDIALDRAFGQDELGTQFRGNIGLNEVLEYAEGVGSALDVQMPVVLEDGHGRRGGECIDFNGCSDAKRRRGAAQSLNETMSVYQERSVPLRRLPKIGLGSLHLKLW